MTRSGHVIGARVVRKLMRDARRLSRQIDGRWQSLPEGWSEASFDPNLLFDAFPRLHLREGFWLAAYQHFAAGEGDGFVFAVPLRRALPEIPEGGFDFDWSPSGEPVFLARGRPLPEWVHPDVENYLDGDGSALSRFQASIFMRELRGMGSFRRGCAWCNHEVLVSAPTQEEMVWRWKEAPPEDWRPAVGKDEAGLWRVVFYSHTGLRRERIVVHLDTFTDDYRFDTEERTVALGEGGYLY